MLVLAYGTMIILIIPNIQLLCRLGNNNITCVGAEQLAEGLSHNQSLQYLGCGQ